jgi:molecular chaperone DnaK
MARDNRVLGNFELSGIPPAPKGIPQIEVKFDVDANGILHVSAHDRASGKAQNVSITGSTTLSKQDIDRMVREAEAHADEDQRRRDAIDLRNQGERLIYQVEEMLKGEYGAKIPADERASTESAIATMRAALAGEDAAALRGALSALEDASRRAGEAIYRASSTESSTYSRADAEVGEGSMEDDEAGAAV